MFHVLVILIASYFQSLFHVFLVSVRKATELWWKFTVE